MNDDSIYKEKRSRIPTFALITLSFCLLILPSIGAELDLSQSFSGYSIKSITGNESKIFGYEGVNLNYDEKTGSLNVCLTPQISDGELVSEEKTICEEYPKEYLDKNKLDPLMDLNCTTKIEEQRYYIPTEMPVFDLNKNSLINTIEKSLLTNKFCITIDNPLAYPLLKLFYNSIIIEGDAEYTEDYKVNITEFTGGAELQLADIPTDYDQMVLQYHFNNETSSDTLPDLYRDNSTLAYDYSSSKLNLSLTNCIWNNTNYKVGEGALTFDGETSYGFIPDTPLLTFGDGSNDRAFSISFWLYPRADTQAYIATKSAFPNGEWALYYNTDTHITFFVLDQSTGGYRSIYSPDGLLTTDEWAYWTFTYTGVETDGQWYKNGDPVITTNTEGGNYVAMENTNSNVVFGSTLSMDGYFMNGTLDEFIWYNKTLSQSDISNIYNTRSHYGEMRWDSLNLGTNTTANISIYNCSVPAYDTSNISARIGDGALVNFTNYQDSCNISDYDLSSVSDLTNTNLTLFLYSNSTDTSTPFIYGNITIDGWGGAVVSTPSVNFTNLTISPEFPTNIDVLNCSVHYQGAWDHINISYRFYRNGVEQGAWNASNVTSNNTISYSNNAISPLTFGDEWICSVSTNETTGWFNSTPRYIYSCNAGSDSIGIIIFLVFLMLLFAFLSMSYFKEHWPIRIFLLLLSVGLVVVILFLSVQITQQQAPPSVCGDCSPCSDTIINGTNIDVLDINASDITANGNLNLTGNFTGNQIYGGMFYHNHTGTTLTFTDANTWYPLYFTNATDLNGFSYVGGFNLSSNLTAQVSGKYQASYMGIGSGQNNHIYLTTIFVDGLEKYECGNHHKMAAGGDVITQSGVCIITINAGETIFLATQDMGGTGDGIYYGGNLNLVRIGS